MGNTQVHKCWHGSNLCVSPMFLIHFLLNTLSKKTCFSSVGRNPCHFTARLPAHDAKVLEAIIPATCTFRKFLAHSHTSCMIKVSYLNERVLLP